MNFSKSMKVMTAISMLTATLLSGAVIGVGSVQAQQNQDAVIKLDDTAPTADIIVTLDNNAPGAVYVEMSGAQALLTDTVSPSALKIVDKRVTSFSFFMRQASSPHKLHFERLAGVATAQVYVRAQTDLPPVPIESSGSNARTVSTAGTVSLTGVMSTALHVAPATMASITASDNANMLSMQLPLQPETAQLVDPTGAVILTKEADNAISGLTVVIVPGQYNLSVINTDATTQADVQLVLSTAPTSLLAAPVVAVCNVQVGTQAVNLRSGPGTGYSIIGHGEPNDMMPVGGTNSQGGWLLVKGKTGPGWVSESLVTTSGTCTSLTTYNIPLRSMSVIAPVTPVVQSAPAAAPQPPSGGGGQGPGDGGGDGGHDGGDSGGHVDN